MGVTYGVLFAVMGLLLLHPTIGLADTVANPYRPLGWISYGILMTIFTAMSLVSITITAHQSQSSPSDPWWCSAFGLS